MPEKILIVEDNPDIANPLRRFLEHEGYQVRVAFDGLAGLQAVYEDPPDLVILDWMLPGLDGLQVLRRLRQGSGVPVLMLTAREGEQNQIEGFRAGSDDYVVKPVGFELLLARVKALLRRGKPPAETVLRFSDLTLDTLTREVTRGTRKIELTAKEFELLHLFLLHPRQVLKRELIYDRVWGYDYAGESNILEVYIRYLRSKLEAAGEPRLLQTVRGAGYALRLEE